MKPYYDHAGITIYHGDCREVMAGLPQVDAVIADPPYNVGLRYKGFVDSMPLDSYKAFSREWFYPAYAASGGNVCVTPGSSNLPFWSTLDPAWVYCWTTSSNTPGGRASMRLGWEPLVVFQFPKKPFGTDVLNYAISKQQGVGDHPCPKPLGMFRVVVSRWCQEGGVVVDPFAGSGTTLVAAKLEGRKAIGIEIEEKYCEIAANRLAQEVLPFAS